MGPRIRRLRWCLGVGYLLPSAVSVTCKSGQTRPQGPERACSEGLLRVQWIEQIPSKSGKIFLDPLVLVLHPFFTMCHLMHSSMYQLPTCTTGALSSSFVWRLPKPSSCWSSHQRGLDTSGSGLWEQIPECLPWNFC